ncbi:MAG: sporulation peptidase YabG [Bacilli bacterium]|nr:sporulation peptidase YabG [Bacilli bacterium]
MNFKKGDLVSRISHNHDVIFKIVDFDGGLVKLNGVNLRLSADADVNDLVIVSDTKNDDEQIIERNMKELDIDRDNYFYLPGKILHIDGDDDYLNRCMNFYKNMGIKANGLTLKEIDITSNIYDLVKEYRPDIVVITGHDAYYSKKKDKNNIDNYQNSLNFVSAVKEVRRYEKSQDKLIVIAGACQSDYEELIKAGANFASSPKRINIHALDPAIIASSVALSDKNQSIDLIKLIEKTKYGSDGIGGIITNGTMYVGYPR